jgi:hypothetical protein
MTRSTNLAAAIAAMALAVSGCAYFQSATPKPSGAGAPPPRTATRARTTHLTSGADVVRAMHDLYAGKYLKTMSFLQNNTAYTTTGQEKQSQWYEHIEAPGKLRIAFLPATQRSGLVQVDDKVASFDNGIRVDFRPSINPLLVLTSDIYAAPVTQIMHELDSLDVDTDLMRTDEWEGAPVYVIGAKAGDTTSNQMWVDADRLLLVRFIQSNKAGDRTIISDNRVGEYKEIQGYQIPTEFLVIRNGRPVWRERYANVRINEDFPPGTFDQARWNDIPIPE